MSKEIMNSELSKTKMTEKELRDISYRWSWHRSLAWNYEKMMSLGYLSTLVPFLERNYKDDEEGRMQAYHTHSVFFNSCPNLSNLILGIDVAIEDKLGKEGLPTVAAIKNSLMGPFAGIGDALVVTTNTIFGSIAVSMALEGSYLGLGIWIVWNFTLMFYIRPLLLKIGYKQGVELVTTLKDKLRNLTNSASMLGLMVVGGMIASIIGVRFGSVDLFGSVIDLQAKVFDPIMPKMGAAMITALCYYLLGKKGMTVVRLLWIVMLLTLILSFFGILIKP
mgnify:CR=1 FL=1